MMKFIDSLERRFGRYAIENITYYLIAGQVLVFLLITSNPQYSRYFILEGRRVMEGQWWLLLTFLFNPVSNSLLFVIFVWYIFYLYGTVLEKRWGAFHYQVYLSICYIGTIILAFIFPDTVLTNAYLYGSLFLAFAYLFPEFQVLLFFIIPVKIKWLAVLSWIGIFGSFILGSFPVKILTLVSVSNFLIFFGGDLLSDAKRILRKSSIRTGAAKELKKAYHICAVCGDNERDNQAMQIRYCSGCMPSTCYCGDHIKNHVHIRKPN